MEGEICQLGKLLRRRCPRCKCNGNFCLKLSGKPVREKLQVAAVQMAGLRAPEVRKWPRANERQTKRHRRSLSRLPSKWLKTNSPTGWFLNNRSPSSLAIVATEAGQADKVGRSNFRPLIAFFFPYVQFVPRRINNPWRRNWHYATSNWSSLIFFSFAGVRSYDWFNKEYNSLRVQFPIAYDIFSHIFHRRPNAS